MVGRKQNVLIPVWRAASGHVRQTRMLLALLKDDRSRKRGKERETGRGGGGGGGVQ